MQTVVGIKFKNSGKVYLFDPNGGLYQTGDKVVVDSASGLSLAQVVTKEKQIEESAIQGELKKIVRKASDLDIKRAEDLRKKAEKDIFLVRDKVRALKLEMKIVSAEYSLDGSKIVIDFSAEERVDFRELLKELASMLKVRIELHQVGQRDEVKIKGGLGPCGEICCCSRFLKDFEHVTVKMAKNQGLSLSPTKISGLCGRLMCCLAYENPTYEEILKRMPKVGSRIDTPKGNGQVVYNDILRERVSVKVFAGDDSATVYDFSLEELFSEKKEKEQVCEEKHERVEKKELPKPEPHEDNEKPENEPKMAQEGEEKKPDFKRKGQFWKNRNRNKKKN